MVINRGGLCKWSDLSYCAKCITELGAEVIEIGTDPNGININEKWCKPM